MSLSHVNFLNSTVKYKVAPSPIHGVGVFAIKDIPEGTKLFADRAPFPYKIAPGNLSKLFPEVRGILSERWPGMENGQGFVYPDIFFQGYMNHSSNPNYCNVTDTALTDIREGEEITEDYRNIDGWQKAYPWLVDNQ